MAALRLEDFLPSYPDYIPDHDRLFTVYGDTDFYEIIQRKKEFNELTLDKEVERVPPNQKGFLLKHQQFIRRFMSGYTPYDSILLWHDVGTGKTGSAIAVAEGMKNFNNSFQKSLLIARSSIFIRNFKNELAYTMTKGEYLPPERALGYTDLEMTRRVNRLINSYYEMDTFQVFANKVRDYSDERIQKEYSNRVIIIDEVHNLRSKKDGGGVETYQSIYRFLHTVKNCKIILLSATPIKDTVGEFASIMNLILPLDQQLPTEDKFASIFFKDDRLVGQDELYPIIKGRISYLRQSPSTLTVYQAGQSVPGISYPIVMLDMKPEQRSIYERAYSQDSASVPLILEEEDEDQKQDENVDDDQESRPSGFYKRSRQASLFAIRDQKTDLYGPTLTKGKVQTKLQEWITPNPSDKSMESKLRELEKYSAKYHYILDLILKNPGQKFFIYCEYISGSGSNVLKELLEKFNFTRSYGQAIESQTKSLRYASIEGTIQESAIENILKVFNADNNMYGEHVQVMIGSSVIGEGRTLKAIRHLVIVSPHWNFTNIDQAIGRGIRYRSHSMLPVEYQTITIHRLAVDDRSSPQQSTSIDVKMYQEAQKKDYYVKQIEELARNTAVDCFFYKPRNMYPEEMDNSRECLYTECNYKCSVETDREDIIDTYNLFYTQKEYSDILDAIQGQFKSGPSFSYTFDELVSNPRLNRYSQIVLMRCLFSIIYQYEPIVNPLGFISYLKEKDNEFFLSYDMLSHSDTSYLYDTRLGQKYPSENYTFSDYLTNYQVDNLQEILTKMNQNIISKNTYNAERTFNSLDEPIRKSIIRKISERSQNEDYEPSPVETYMVQKEPAKEKEEEQDSVKAIIAFRNHVAEVAKRLKKPNLVYGILLKGKEFAISSANMISTLNQSGRVWKTLPTTTLLEYFHLLIPPSRRAGETYKPNGSEEYIPLPSDKKASLGIAIERELRYFDLFIEEDSHEILKTCYDENIEISPEKCLRLVFDELNQGKKLATIKKTLPKAKDWGLRPKKKVEEAEADEKKEEAPVSKPIVAAKPAASKKASMSILEEDEEEVVIASKPAVSSGVGKKEAPKVQKASKAVASPKPKGKK
jgi:superfamily II DNA or RNA helicase